MTERTTADLTGEEREQLLALMDRVDGLGEARLSLALAHKRPELKARYLKALGEVEEEARAHFEEARRELVLDK
jgi:hypothetical protein